MKNWQILVLCCTIILSIAAASYYLKHELNQTLTTNYGPVVLGEVFAEKPMIDIVLINIEEGTEEVLIKGGSFYDKAEPVDDAMKNLVTSWQKRYGSLKDIPYDEISPNTNDIFKVKISTYITYNSSNFNNLPYTLNIKEESFPLFKGESIKSKIESKVSWNFEYNRENVARNLFITNLEAYDLIGDTSNSKVED